jgi:hypothetical protein
LGLNGSDFLEMAMFLNGISQIEGVPFQPRSNAGASTEPREKRTTPYISIVLCVNGYDE